MRIIATLYCSRGEGKVGLDDIYRREVRFGNLGRGEWLRSGYRFMCMICKYLHGLGTLVCEHIRVFGYDMWQ